MAGNERQWDAPALATQPPDGFKRYGPMLRSTQRIKVALCLALWHHHMYYVRLILAYDETLDRLDADFCSSLQQPVASLGAAWSNLQLPVKK